MTIHLAYTFGQGWNVIRRSGDYAAATLKVVAGPFATRAAAITARDKMQ